MVYARTPHCKAAMVALMTVPSPLAGEGSRKKLQAQMGEGFFVRRPLRRDPLTQSNTLTRFHALSRKGRGLNNAPRSSRLCCPHFLTQKA